MRIFWLNWRCIKHPLASGVEVYTHEIARRLSGQRHELALITLRPSNLLEMRLSIAIRWLELLRKVCSSPPCKVSAVPFSNTEDIRRNSFVSKG